MFLLSTSLHPYSLICLSFCVRDYCVEQGCDFFFSVDSESHLDNPYTLKLLLEQNRSVEVLRFTRFFRRTQ